MKFKLLVADWDSPLLRAAKSVQEDYILVTHNKSGHVKEFENKTEFYGHWKKKEGGWLRLQNDKRVQSKSKLLLVEDFSIEECVRLAPDIENHLEEAESSFDYSVGRLKKSVEAEDYKLVIGGEGNFRYDEAKQQPYKGKRKEKPLLFQELKELVIKKYKNKIIVVDGREADDYCGAIGWRNYLSYKKTGKWVICLAYIDKDLKMIISPSINYDDDKPEVKINTPFEAAKCYAVQLLCGDKATDNIPGLPNFTKEIQEKYDLTTTRGIGATSAENYLKPCTEVKEMFERVVEAYKSYYGEETQKYLAHTGEELDWNWKNYLQDNANLLWMHRRQDCKYNIFEDTLKPLGVEY